MTRAERRLERTAYHEAGHAVACWAYGLRFKRVTVVPRDDSLGHLAGWPWGKGMQAYSLTAASERRFEAQIVCCLAGGLAAKQAGFRDLGSHSDLQLAVNCAAWLLDGGFRPVCGSDVEEALLRFCHVCAKQVVGFRWVCVEALARALVAKGTLSEAEALDVIREAWLREADEWRADAHATSGEATG